MKENRPLMQSAGRTMLSVGSLVATVAGHKRRTDVRNQHLTKEDRTCLRK
ncbi:Mobile element protein [Hydrogenibacillus schlegelii]